MEIRNPTIESFLKGRAFSALLCLYCAFFAFMRTRMLLERFDLFELLHLVFNVTFAALFLTRVRAVVVSMNITHWTVALVTSFSGFFFVREAASPGRGVLLAGDVLMIFAGLVQMAAALTLGRSLGFLPALRRVKTEYVYGIVRHPMYMASIVVKLGYILRNPSIVNAMLFVAVAVLYDRRAKYEEDILSHDHAYVEYMQQVKYRFMPQIR